jgi:hypothetical protein
LSSTVDDRMSIFEQTILIETLNIIRCQFDNELRSEIISKINTDERNVFYDINIQKMCRINLIDIEHGRHRMLVILMMLIHFQSRTSTFYRC